MKDWCPTHEYVPFTHVTREVMNRKTREMINETIHYYCSECGLKEKVDA